MTVFKYLEAAMICPTKVHVQLVVRSSGRYLGHWGHHPEKRYHSPHRIQENGLFVIRESGTSSESVFCITTRLFHINSHNCDAIHHEAHTRG